MRTLSTPQAPAAHPSRPRGARPRAGPAAAALVLAAACAAILATTAHAAPAPHAAQRPSLEPLPVVVLPPPSPAPAVTPVALPSTGSDRGIEAPGAAILPPVAVLPAPSDGRAAAQSLIALPLLAVFVATLLVATVLTARRRL